MTEPNTYTPRTLEEVTALEAFIRARVTPLRDADDRPYNADEQRAVQALLDVCTVMLGGAGHRAKAGQNIDTVHFYLYTAARQWRDHPDFLPEWNR